MLILRGDLRVGHLVEKAVGDVGAVVGVLLKRPFALNCVLTVRAKIWPSNESLVGKRKTLRYWVAVMRSSVEAGPSAAATIVLIACSVASALMWPMTADAVAGGKARRDAGGGDGILIVVLAQV